MKEKRRLIFWAKLAISAGIITWIVFKVVHREGAEDLWARLSQLSWGWIAVAALMQLCAVGTSVLRWDRLLAGQGIFAPLPHLVGSFMVGRFFGAFTPGGWTGLNGYRLYDIAKHTGKAARSTAAIGIEMVLGYLAFSVVVIIGSVFGLEVIGSRGVLTVDGFFLLLIGTAIALISRPGLFRILASRLPRAFRGRLQTTVDAVCAYQGRPWLVTQAVLLGVGTHAFNNLIYVATARALGVELGVGQVFFVSAMQIFATLLPASLNGIGVREATAVALYTGLGVPASVAFLIPTVGFTVEMFISSFGGLVFMARRVGYSVDIQVQQADREQLTNAAVPEVPRERWPQLLRGTAIGMGAGMLGGGIVGMGEAAVVWASGASRTDLSVVLYGMLGYGLGCAAAGASLGWLLALSGRLMRREAVPDAVAYGRFCASLAALGALFIGAFRVRRDLFQEQLVWKSPNGLLVLAGCALAALLSYLMLSRAVRALVTRRPGRLLLRSWGSPAVMAGLLSLVGATALSSSFGHGVPTTAVNWAKKTNARATASAGNIFVFIVDTLRADHLPLYGYRKIETPHLDAFAQDAVRFDQAFVNSSWTRPSFASFLTGRYPSCHKTIFKSDSLPDAIVTLPEALKDGGYSTMGVVTNYNLAPFFNFHQGFDLYRYLEPDFVLGASDAAAKLLIMQFVRQRLERLRAQRGAVQPGSAYQDAATVNRAILELLDSGPPAPWFMFVGYMDPHDPYYPHPYDGTGYARAAHPRPEPAEAPELRRLYDGEIVYWDRHFGNLIAELKRRDLYDKSTIIVTSDHGEEFMEHGGFWHGTTLYDEQVRVPLLLKLPENRQAGTVAHHWVESIDIMPALLKYAGLAIPDGVQGKDLFVASDSVFAEENHEGNVLESLRIRRGTSEIKLITANLDNPRGVKPEELYRLDRDPGEREDLSQQQPQTLLIARKDLNAYKRQAARGAVKRQAVVVTAEQEERLRALGYVEQDEPPNAPHKPSEN